MCTTTYLEGNITRTWGGHQAVRCSDELLSRYRTLLEEQRLSWTNHHRLTRLLGAGGQACRNPGQDQGKHQQHSPHGVPPGSAYNGCMAASATTSPFRIVHTVCSHDCPDSCAVLVTVDASGRAIKVQGDPSQPITQGFLCGKVAKYLDRVYAPERILHPLRRKPGVAKGPLVRGQEDEAFERVSWDEALDEIAARLQTISDEHGPESILPYSYAGTIGVLGFGSMDRRFFHRLGGSQLDRTICSEAGGVAWNLVYGKKLGMAPEDFRLA